MDYNFVDTDEIKISDNIELELCEIPGTSHKVFIIDNFLKNPEDLKLIATCQIFEKDPGKNKSTHPGWVSITNLKFNQIAKTAEYIVKNYCGIPYNGDIKTQFNLFEGGMPSKYTHLIPHVDQSFFAYQVYLNSPEECQGGTSFYRHIETGLDHNVRYFDAEFIKSEKCLKLMEYYEEVEKNDYNTILDYRQLKLDEWEKIYEIPMRYNRFILYPSYVFHCPYIEKEWFQENKRIGLVSFMR